jgi:hypothetical protein
MYSALESLWRLYRASYWRFLLDAATRYRHVFGTAVTLAIMGYHFYAVTEAVCRTD